MSVANADIAAPIKSDVAAKVINVLVFIVSSSPRYAVYYECALDDESHPINEDLAKFVPTTVKRRYIRPRVCYGGPESIV